MHFEECTDTCWKKQQPSYVQYLMLRCMIISTKCSFPSQSRDIFRQGQFSDKAVRKSLRKTRRRIIADSFSDNRNIQSPNVPNLPSCSWRYHHGQHDQKYRKCPHKHRVYVSVASHSAASLLMCRLARLRSHVSGCCKSRPGSATEWQWRVWFWLLRPAQCRNASRILAATDASRCWQTLFPNRRQLGSAACGYSSIDGSTG